METVAKDMTKKKKALVTNYFAYISVTVVHQDPKAQDSKIIKGLQHLSCKKRIRELGLQFGKEKAWGHLINRYKYLMGRDEEGARLFCSGAH